VPFFSGMWFLQAEQATLLDTRTCIQQRLRGGTGKRPHGPVVHVSSCFFFTTSSGVVCLLLSF
jgi:hypothetical protein